MLAVREPGLPFSARLPTNLSESPCADVDYGVCGDSHEGLAEGGEPREREAADPAATASKYGAAGIANLNGMSRGELSLETVKNAFAEILLQYSVQVPTQPAQDGGNGP